MSPSVNWKVRGLYSEACNCESVCPCYSHKDPSYGFCEGPCIWHIQKGHYGDVDLAGMTVVMVQHCSGHMERSKWKCWFHVDNHATDEQFEALRMIFTAKAGGYIGRVYERLWDVLSFERAPMDVQIDGWQHSVSILGKLEISFGHANLRINAGPVLCFLPNVPGVAAVAEVDKFDNGEISFSHPGKNALATTFNYRSE
jgi:hypothetical protein